MDEFQKNTASPHSEKAIKAGTIRINTKANTIDLSENARNMLGFENAGNDICIKEFTNLIVPEDRSGFRNWISELEKAHARTHIQLRFKLGGSDKTFLLLTDIDNSNQGEINVIITSVEVNGADTAQLQKERYKQVIDRSPFIVQVFEAVRDNEGKIEDFVWVFNNRKAVEQNGDVIGKSLLQQNPGVQQKGLFEKFVSVTETGEAVDHEVFYEYEQFNGWFHQILIKMDDGFVMSTEDITDRKIAEQELSKTRDLLKNILDTSPLSITAYKPLFEANELKDFEFVFVNAFIERISGIDPTGKRLIDTFPMAKENGFFAKIKETFENKKIQDFEFWYEGEGMHRWFHHIALPMEEIVLVTTEDITERKIAQQEVIELQKKIAKNATEKYYSIFNSTQDAFCIIELIYNETGHAVDLKFLETNPVYEKLTGAKNPVGKLTSEVFPGTEQYWIDTYEQIAKTGEPAIFENWHGPTQRWYSVVASKVGEEEQNQIAIIANDITSRKENELKQSVLLRHSDGIRRLYGATKITELTCKIIAEELSASRAQYNDVEGTPGNEMGIVQSEYIKDGLPMLRSYPLSAFGEPLVELLRKGDTLVIENVATDERIPDDKRAAFVAVDSPAAISVPLIKDNKLIAVFTVHDLKPRKWTKVEVEIMEELAERTWSAVERVKAEETLQHQLTALKQVNEELQEARHAALNILEDATAAREALQHSEDELRKLNVSLEKEVEKRTAEWKATNDLLQIIFETTLVGIAMLEPVKDEASGEITDFTIKISNKKFEDLTGKNDITGKRYTITYPDLKRTDLFKTMAAVVKTGKSAVSEYSIGTDGNKKWLSVSYIAFEENLVVTYLDITERKNHEEELSKNLSILQQSEEMILMGSWEYEIETKKFSLSNGMQRLFALKPSQKATPDIYLLKAPKNSRLSADRIVRHITEEFKPFEEIVQLKHEGGARVIKVKAAVIQDEEKNPLKVVGVDIDITDESRSAEIIRLMSEMLFEVDNNWTIKFSNSAADRFLKLGLSGKNLWQAAPYLVGSAFYRALLHSMESRKKFKKEFHIESLNKWIYVSVSPSPSGLIVLFTDIQAQKNAAERLKESEQRLRTVFENTPDVVSRWGKDLRLIFSNKALEEKTGIPYAQLLGKTFREMGVGQDTAKPYMDKLEMVLHTGMATEHFNYFPSLSGPRYYYSRIVPEFDLNGKVQSVLGIARDVTILKKRQEELVEKNRLLGESQESLERKDNFIRIASHELKTPITSMQGYAQLLLETYQQDEKDDFLTEGLSVINRQVNKLTKLINDLLDITRVDTGSMKLEMKVFDLCEMVKETVDFMRPTTLHELIFTGFDCTLVYGDRERINQVFLNLLTNAIKYSPKGKKVEISIMRNEDRVIVAVKDYGIGIANTFHEKIFDRFYRVQGSSEKTFSGFGIGLFIANEIIKQHKGNIWVESKENEGSTFYFSLPVTKD